MSRRQVRRCTTRSQWYLTHPLQHPLSVQSLQRFLLHLHSREVLGVPRKCQGVAHLQTTTVIFVWATCTRISRRDIQKNYYHVQIVVDQVHIDLYDLGDNWISFSGLMFLLYVLFRASLLSSVYWQVDRKCQEIQMAVHWMQILHPLWNFR